MFVYKPQQYLKDAIGDRMIHHETDVDGTSGGDRNLPKTSKQLINQPVNCPWTSRAPLTIVPGLRSLIPSRETTPHQFNEDRASDNHESTNQFFHFLRLMQLFPEVHPATLHTVMFLCKNDFFAAVDKLLYAKRCKNELAQRRNMWAGRGVIRMHQHHVATTSKPHESVPTTYSNEKVCPRRPADSLRFVYRSRSNITTTKTETNIPNAVDPQYPVPIGPLSPPSVLPLTQTNEQRAD